MKRIVLAITAVAALAACTKSEVAYEAPAEIGFKAVAGNITKTAVDGDVYPTSLNMYVFAETADNTDSEANYILNGEFKYRGAYNNVVTDANDSKNPNVWGGWKDDAAYPYYWPNTKNLRFAGYSKSGNVTTATVAYDCQNDVLTISGYAPGTGVDNDLMYFPKTGEYGKNTTYVPVSMYHTCAWISFLVKGDEVTGATGSTYSLTNLTITDIDATADLTCTGTAITWEDNTDNDATSAVLTSSVALAGTGLEGAEAVEAETTPNSTVLIPQLPGKLNLTYTYESSTGALITETVTGLDLGLDTRVEDANTGDTVNKTPWEAGKHYIYTITIKANEILIAPTPVDWTDGNFNVTVE
jgi:hypothetical protein